MSYPTDSGVSYSTKTNNVDVINDTDINNLQTEVTSIKTLLGTIGSVVSGTFYYLMSEVTSTDKAVGKTATQTVANKTLGTGTKVSIGSDADKDMYYRASDGTLTRIPVGTDNQILKLNGTTPNWEVETTTVNASTTVAGISELATAAEITAGTATGGTGAALVVTPDALASSAPTFSGANLTGVIKTSTNYHITTTVTASSNPRGSYSDSASSTLSAAQTTYTKLKEIVFTDVSGTITATWTVSLVAGGSGLPYTKIYKNGSAVGAEKTNTGSNTESSISVSTGDLIQVYGHMTGGDTGTYNINTFRLNYDKTTTFVTDYITNTVNL